jgi:hypothetical protein
MALAGLRHPWILTLCKARSVNIHLLLIFRRKLRYNRCWKGSQPQGQGHECEPASYVHTPLKVSETDSSAYLAAEKTKAIYRPMPSSSSNFVGREDYLAELEALFVEERNQTDSRPVGVLSGLGGMGKTQLSVRFIETRSHL